MSKFTKWAVLGLALLLCPLIVLSLRRGSTPPIKDEKGNRIPDSISALEKVSLGGMEQWVLIRGEDASNPILLWLHGGPGAAQMPVARYFNGVLEKEFVVVHWDQRGAGKSNPRSFDENTMAFQRFIDDAHELAVYLKERFQQDKIYLVGHSWGTQIGIKLAQAYPEDYYAYVGVSQVVDPAASQEAGHTWLLEQVEKMGTRRDLERLEALGRPPYTDHEAYVEFARMIDAYGGSFDVGMARLLWIGLRAPEYTPGDMLTWLQGSNRGSGPMWEEPAYRSFNAMQDVPQLLISVYFFNGRIDYNTPLEVTERYVEQLGAPQGKELVIFEASAHTPFFGEADKFNQELIRVKEEIQLGRVRGNHNGSK